MSDKQRRNLLIEAAEMIERLSTENTRIIEALESPTEAMWAAAWEASADYFVADRITKEGFRLGLAAMIRQALAGGAPAEEPAAVQA